MKHTQGEWELKSDSFKVWIESPQWSICEVYEKHPKKEQIANAKLIASAPELLEALQKLMEVYDDKGQLLDFNVNIARQAIKKATE